MYYYYYYSVYGSVTPCDVFVRVSFRSFPTYLVNQLLNVVSTEH